MSLDKLASFIERHVDEDGEHETAIPELALYRASSVTEHNASTYVPCLCIVAQGAKEIVLGGEPYRYDPSHSLLVSIDLPATSRVVEASPKRPCLVARINLNLAVVGEMLAEHATAPTLKPGRALALAPMTPPLQDAVERLVAMLGTPEDIRPLAPLILREITYRLLTGPQGSRLRQIASTGAPAHRISKAIIWLKDHFAEPLIVEELAGRVGLAPSTLHLHFKNITAMSPLQYQKQLRLQEARRLLLGECLDAASVAYRVGYESPSQFSREYRRMFGAPPRQDVAEVKVRI